MKKVGIMSMQRIANYGSFLQVYALRKLLEKEGCSVEFVDYHVDYHVDKPVAVVDLRKKLKSNRSNYYENHRNQIFEYDIDNTVRQLEDIYNDENEK